MAEQDDSVGTLAEELAKLMGVVSGIADRTPPDAEQAARPEGSADSDADGRSGHSAEHGPHIADGSASCQICPVCQTISFVRTASPEVREQLTASAASLAAAARGVFESFAAQHSSHEPSARDSRVENIDLSEDGQWD